MNPTTEPKPTPLNAHLGMLLWSLIVGLSFPVVGMIGEGLPPLLLTSTRFAIAALAIWPLLPRGREHRPGAAGAALYAVMGLSLAGFFGAMFWAAHRASSLSMATLYVSVPLLAYFLGRAAGVERPARRLLAILALGAGGALALAWAESAGNLGTLSFGAGEAVFLAGCLGSAMYPVASKWGLQRDWLSPRAELRAFWSLVAGSVLVGLLGLAGETPARLMLMTSSDALVLIYLGVFSSGVTFWLMQRATAVLSPASVTSYTYLAPFPAMVLLFAGQPLLMGWRWLPGIVMVVTAIALLLRRDTLARVSARSPAPVPCGHAAAPC